MFEHETISKCCVCNKLLEQTELQGCIMSTHIFSGSQVTLHIHFHFSCAMRIIMGSFTDLSQTHKNEISMILFEKLTELNMDVFERAN